MHLKFWWPLLDRGGEIYRGYKREKIRKSQLENKETQILYFKTKIIENPNSDNTDLMRNFRKEFPLVKLQIKEYVYSQRNNKEEITQVVKNPAYFI